MKYVKDWFLAVVGSTALPLLTLALVVSTPVHGQLAPPPGSAYVVISYNQVDWRRVDSLSKLIKTYRLPQAEEAKKAGNLLEYRYLFHTWGTEWNVVLIRKFRNWAVMETGRDTTMAAALRKIVPDSAQRAAVAAGFAWALDGNAHRDEIYAEVVR